MMGISFGACLYALWELSRRAGVTFDFFDRWKISHQADTLVIHLGSDSLAEVRFPLFCDHEWEPTRVAEKGWTREVPQSILEQVPNFLVPFCRRESISQQPLFIQENQQVFTCTEDLLKSILLTLCRYEEIDSAERDIHGRFPASASIASRYGFLKRPIVDEYGLAFQQILEILIPGWRPAHRNLRVKLSHDIDLLGIPFSLKSAIGHVSKRGAPLSCVRDLLSIASTLDPTYLYSVRTLCNLSLARGLRSALYWTASAPGPFDTGYDLSNPKIARTIDWANAQGVEMGVHPGYETFLARPKLRAEVERCKKAVSREKIGGRQHYLRWCPATWEDWESCDLAYDSTVGFSEHIGFRAGTCIPYLPWLWNLDRSAELLEIPLLVMDGAVVDQLRLKPDESLRAVRELLNRCELVGGVFTLLWHNSGLTIPYAQHYLPILDVLSGKENYDWEMDAKQLRHEAHQLHERRCTSDWPFPLPFFPRVSSDVNPTETQPE
jgi:hypothetical protein